MSRYTIKFYFHDDICFTINGWIKCIEYVKKYVIDNKIEYDTILFFDDKNKLVAKMGFMKDLFSNGYKWYCIKD